MDSTHEILQKLREAKPKLARRYGVTGLSLFGSYARGDQNEESDVDVLVEVPPSVGLRFVELAEEIESVVGVRSEVISRRAVSPRNWEEIRKELVIVS